MRPDYSENTTQKFGVYDSYGRWFPSHVECSYCGGRGYVNFERETRHTPASSDPCEFCAEGKTYSPRTRLVRRYVINRKHSHGVAA